MLLEKTAVGKTSFYIFAILISLHISVLGLLLSIPNTAARVTLYMLSLLGSQPQDDIYFSWSKSPSP